MKKLLIVAALIFAVCLYVGWNMKPNKSYTLSVPHFTKPITVDTESQVIAVMLNQSVFIKNAKTHCIQKVLFWNFSKGYVNCGHMAGESVYHVHGNDNLPEKMHFTLTEMSL